MQEGRSDKRARVASRPAVTADSISVTRGVQNGTDAGVERLRVARDALRDSPELQAAALAQILMDGGGKPAHVVHQVGFGEVRKFVRVVQAEVRVHGDVGIAHRV